MKKYLLLIFAIGFLFSGFAGANDDGVLITNNYLTVVNSSKQPNKSITYKQFSRTSLKAKGAVRLGGWWTQGDVTNNRFRRNFKKGKINHLYMGVRICTPKPQKTNWLKFNTSGYCDNVTILHPGTRCPIYMKDMGIIDHQSPDIISVYFTADVDRLILSCLPGSIPINPSK